MTESGPGSFAVAEDGVDPAPCPSRSLWTGARMPAIGLGTFGSDRFSGEEIADAVLGAAAVGYRHFDCATVYGNEHLIGASLETIQAGGIRARGLWVTSKLWNDKHDPADVIPTFRESLAGPAARLPGSVPGPLAVPEPPRAGRGRDVTRPQRQAVHPRRVHGHLARAGEARRHGPGPAHRHVEHVDRQAEAAAPRRPHQAGLQRDGAAPVLPAAGALQVRGGQRDRPDRLRADRLADPPGSRQDRGRHGRHRGPGHRRHREAAGRAPGDGLRQVGRPARAGPDPLLDLPQRVPEQPASDRLASRSRTRR